MVPDGSSWTKFLDYGAIGLAGMMLVLVIIVLLSGAIDERKARLLRQFLYVGAFCFVIAMIPQFLAKPPPSEHLIHFRVEPLLQGANPTLPPPIITVNSQRLDGMSFLVRSEVTAIVDVSDAVNTAQQLRTVTSNQDRVLASLSDDITTAMANLQQSASDVVGDICPGGSNGRPPSAGPRIARQINTATTALSGAQSAIANVRSDMQ